MCNCKKSCACELEAIKSQMCFQSQQLEHLQKLIKPYAAAYVTFDLTDNEYKYSIERYVNTFPGNKPVQLVGTTLGQCQIDFGVDISKKFYYATVKGFGGNGVFITVALSEPEESNKILTVTTDFRKSGQQEPKLVGSSFFVLII